MCNEGVGMNKYKCIILIWKKIRKKLKVKKKKKLMTIKEVTDNKVVHRIKRHKRIYVANLNSSGLQLSF